MTIPSIPLTRFSLSLAATAPVRLPVNPGDRFHSRFGCNLRRLVCATGTPNCDGCKCARQCPYGYLFRTPAPDVGHPLLRHGGAAPHPFVSYLGMGPRTMREGDVLDMEILLIGRACDYLPYVVLTVERMGDSKPGVQRGFWPFTLESVVQDFPVKAARELYSSADGSLAEPAPPGPARFQKPARSCDMVLQVVTPVHIKRAGRSIRRAPSLKALLTVLLRRIASLAAAHTDLPHIDGYRELLAAAEGVRHRSRGIRTASWTRHSSRQVSGVPMSGIMGEITYFEVPPEIVPWLKLGEVLHVGKGTGFGLGRYRIHF